MKLAILLAVPALVACPKQRDEPRDEKRDEPERPVPERRATASVPFDRLLAEARSHAGAGEELSRIDIAYVKADGTIDPAYGTVEVRFAGQTQRGPVDDPKRPTGAPITRAERPQPPTCTIVSWRAGVWSGIPCPSMTVRTSKPGSVLALRCTVPIIWERAIAGGAPRDAVASLRISAGDEPAWHFSIEDKLRDVHFSDMFPDDCGLVAEAPDPTVGPDTMPDAIEREIIKNAIGTVKADVIACGNNSTARGQVKVAVKVAPDGATTVTIKASPDAALGACVKAAVERATFPATRNGGSFAYPFVF